MQKYDNHISKTEGGRVRKVCGGSEGALWGHFPDCDGRTIRRHKRETFTCVRGTSMEKKKKKDQKNTWRRE